IYNGKTYTLACYNSKSMVLSLVEISADGFVMNTTFADLPTNVGEDFRLFRDRSQIGVNASVLVWPGYSEDDNSQARIFASRISAADHDHAMLVTSPITAAIIKTPSTTGSDAEVGVFVLSYDAYIEENDLKILTLFRESTSGGT
ncbi:MAG TPA: hypothetical protein DDZ89_03645, partial [Clostridiales bacterium]|nr:hypothetical protein [Clostridiales bacterium]